MPINLDFVNGNLEAMRCLNTGLNHGCYFFMQLLVYKGNCNNTLSLSTIISLSKMLKVSIIKQIFGIS